MTIVCSSLIKKNFEEIVIKKTMVLNFFLLNIIIQNKKSHKKGFLRF